LIRRKIEIKRDKDLQIRNKQFSIGFPKRARFESRLNEATKYQQRKSKTETYSASSSSFGSSFLASSFLAAAGAAPAAAAGAAARAPPVAANFFEPDRDEKKTMEIS
jgi:hypothetical protein